MSPHPLSTTLFCGYTERDCGVWLSEIVFDLQVYLQPQIAKRFYDICSNYCVGLSYFFFGCLIVFSGQQWGRCPCPLCCLVLKLKPRCLCLLNSMLADKLNMSPEEAERWIVNLICNARLDAKIDSKLVSSSSVIGHSILNLSKKLKKKAI